jgi:hypothetical protein
MVAEQVASVGGHDVVQGWLEGRAWPTVTR